PSGTSAGAATRSCAAPTAPLPGRSRHAGRTSLRSSDMSRGSCSAQSVLAGVPRIAVSVNGVAIPHDAISREAQNHPAPTPLDAWKAAARALIVRELLLAEARRLQIRREPAED